MERNKQIDGLRGITILLIGVFHLFCRYREIYCGYTIWYLKWMGDFGNIIFLLISSYFLIGITGEKIHLKEFINKKIVRLWPSYVVAITVIMVSTQIFPLPGRTCSWKDYLLNVVFLNGFLGRAYVDGAHWYITTLIGATIAVAIIKYYKIEERFLTYIALLFLEGISGLLGIRPLNQILGSSYAPIICIGIAIHIMQQKGYKIRSLLKIREWDLREYFNNNKWFFLCIICYGYLFLRKGRLSFICLCMALPVFLLALKKKIFFLENSVAHFMGMISYPFYLIHQNLAYLIEYNVSNRFDKLPLNLVACGALVMVLLAGIGLYYMVEKPIQYRLNNRTKKGV